MMSIGLNGCAEQLRLASEAPWKLRLGSWVADVHPYDLLIIERHSKATWRLKTLMMRYNTCSSTSRSAGRGWAEKRGRNKGTPLDVCHKSPDVHFGVRSCVRHDNEEPRMR